jgi:hypothetical protein
VPAARVPQTWREHATAPRGRMAQGRRGPRVVFGAAAPRPDQRSKAPRSGPPPSGLGLPRMSTAGV